MKRFGWFTDGVRESEQGRFMLVEDHLAIVDKLKQELQEHLEDAYNKGWDEGHSAGYCEGSLGNDL